MPTSQVSFTESTYTRKGLMIEKVRPMTVIWRSCVLWILVSGVLIVGAQTVSDVTIAYIQDGDIIVVNSGSSHQITDTADVVGLVISPDGERIAYQRELAYEEDDGFPVRYIYGLWAINSDGSDSVELLSGDDLLSEEDGQTITLGQVQWLSDNVRLAYNTFSYPTAVFQDYGRYRNDFYLLDTRTGEYLISLTDDGGKFAISPNEQWVALGQSTSTSMLNLQTGELLKDAFTFTEGLYPDGAAYLDIAWAQDSHSVVVITPTDSGLLYGEEVYIGLNRVYTDGVVINIIGLGGAGFDLSQVSFSPYDDVAMLRVSGDPINYQYYDLGKNVPWVDHTLTGVDNILFLPDGNLLYQQRTDTDNNGIILLPGATSIENTYSAPIAELPGQVIAIQPARGEQYVYTVTTFDGGTSVYIGYLFAGEVVFSMNTLIPYGSELLPTFDIGVAGA